MKTAISPQLM